MIRLFYYPGSASLAPHFLLRELRLEYELVLVDRERNAQKQPEYLQLNPLGRVPTLTHDNVVCYEAPAICMYLADMHSRLLGAPGSLADRAKVHQQLAVMANTLQPALMMYHYPEQYLSSQAGLVDLRECAERRATATFAVLEAQLGADPYLAGRALSVCDFYHLMLCRWARGFAEPPRLLPNTGRLLRELAARPSVIEVCARERIEAPYA